MLRSRSSCLALLLVVPLLVVPPAGAAPAARADDVQTCSPAGGASSSLAVTGWTGEETSYDAAALAALPRTTVADTYLAGSGTTQRNYTGVDLWRLLDLPENDGGRGTLVLPPDPAGPQGAGQRNDITRYRVAVTGSDCFEAVFSMAEISPFFGGGKVVVATAQGDYDPDDLTPVTESLGDAGFARISNPLDVRGSRRVANVVEVRVLPPAPSSSTPPASSPTCTRAPSTSLRVNGWVKEPRTYDAAALGALEQTTVADSFLAGSGSTQRNFTGVELWRLLGLSVSSGGTGDYLLPNPPGPQAPAAQRNDLTRYAVMITATDCFQALVSLAEISPFFGGRKVVVATAQGAYDPDDTTTPVTESLGTDGFARISLPADVRGSRRVSNVASITVLPAPTPTTTWERPTAVVAGTPLGAKQLDPTTSYLGASVPGSFAFAPAAGTVLPVGQHELTALFSPSRPGRTTLARAVTTLTVMAEAPRATVSRGAAVVEAGRGTTVATRLTASGAPVAGALLRLQARPARSSGAFVDVGTATTDARGRAARRVAPRTGTSYRWVFDGSPDQPPATSPTTSVAVRPVVGLRVLRRPAAAGGPLVVRATSTPARAGSPVVLWRQRAGDRVRLARGVLRPDGAVRITTRLRQPGRYHVFVTVAGRDGLVEGRSPVRVVRLRR